MNRRELTFFLRFSSNARQGLRATQRSIHSLGAAAQRAAVRGLKVLQRSLDAVAKRALLMGRALTNAGRRMREVGSVISLGLTAPLVAMGAGILKVAGSFEQSMNRVQAISEATAEQFVKLRKKAAELGATTAFTATDAAEGLVFLAKTGFSVKEMLDAIGPSLDLAAAGNISLAEAANIVTNVLKGFRQEVEQLPKAVDILSKAFVSSNVDILQLSQSFKLVGPVAASAGQDFAETATVLGALGDASIQASLAGTSLRRILINLQKDEAKRKSILRSLNVELRDEHGNIRGLIDIFADLKKAGISNIQTIDLFGARAKAAADVLLDRSGPAMAELANKIRHAGGTAERLQKVQLKGLFGAFRKLKSAVESVGIAVGDAGLLGTVTRFIDKVTDWIRSLRDARAEMINNIVIIGGIAAAIGPVLIMMGLASFAVGQLTVAFAGLVKGIGLAVKALRGLTLASLVNPWTALAVALGVAIALLIKYRDAMVTVGGEQATVMDFVLGTWDLFAAKVGEVTTAANKAFNDFFNEVGSIFGDLDVEIGGFTSSFLDKMRIIGNTGIKIWKVQLVFATRVFKTLWGIIANFKDNVVKAFTGLGNLIKAAFTLDYKEMLVQAKKIAAATPLGQIAEGLKEGMEEIRQVMKSDPLGDLIGDIGEAGRRRFVERMAKAGKEGAEALATGGKPPAAGEEEEDGADPTPKPGFMDDFLAGAQAGFKEWTQMAGDAATQGKEFFNTFADGATDALLDFVETGKFSFKDLFNDLIRQLNKIALNRIWMGLIQGAQGGFAGAKEGGGIGGFFSGFGSGFAGGFGGSTSVPATTAAKGGISDELSRNIRVPAALFATARRYAQGGVPGGAIPTLLHPREAVVPLSGGRSIPVEMRPGSKGGEERPVSISVRMIVQTPDPGTFRKNQGQMAAELMRNLRGHFAQDA